MVDINCPYCDHGYNFTGDPLDEDKTYEEQCPECEKLFNLSCYVTVHYRTNVADCRNDGKHKIEDACRTPKVVRGKVLQRCRTCQKENDRDASQPEIDAQIKSFGESFRSITERKTQ